MSEGEIATNAPGEPIPPSKATSLLWSADFGIGAATALGTGILAFLCEGVLEVGPTALTTEAGVGVALLAVVIAGLAIFSTFFDDNYRRVLEEASGSVRQAMVPYQMVAGVAASAVLAAIGSVLVWPAAWTWLQALLLGLTTGLVAWTTVGGVQLVEITMFHAEQRAKLMRGIEDSKRQLSTRRRQPAERSIRR